MQVVLSSNRRLGARCLRPLALIAYPVCLSQSFVTSSRPVLLSVVLTFHRSTLIGAVALHTAPQVIAGWSVHDGQGGGRTKHLHMQIGNQPKERDQQSWRTRRKSEVNYEARIDIGQQLAIHQSPTAVDARASFCCLGKEGCMRTPNITYLCTYVTSASTIGFDHAPCVILWPCSTAVER